MADIATTEAVRYLLGLQELVRVPDRAGPETAAFPAGGSAPTVVIAASNSHIKTQMKADYVAQTANATDETGQALQDLRFRGGGRLLFTEGLFQQAALHQVDFPLTVEGMGRGATIIQNFPGTGHSMFELLGSENHYSFEKLTLDGNKANVSGSGSGIVSGMATEAYLYVANCWIRDMDGFGITMDRTAGYTQIQSSWISGCATGVSVQGEGFHHLYDNMFDGNTSHASITGAVAVVTGNRFQGGTTGLSSGGLLDSGSNLIASNMFRDLGGTAISLASLFNGRVPIVGNRIHNCGGSGIVGAGTEGHFAVVGNMISECDGSGIEISAAGGGRDGSLAVGNVVYGCGQHGIWFHNIIEGLIEGNVVSDCGLATNNTWDGIIVSQGNENSAHSTAVLCNKVRDTAGGNEVRYGIRIDTNYLDAFVAGNDTRGAGVSGQYSDAGTGTINAWAGVFGDNI